MAVLATVIRWEEKNKKTKELVKTEAILIISYRLLLFFLKENSEAYTGNFFSISGSTNNFSG